MKPNNVNTFLGLAALWLVLASSSLGAPCGSSMHRRDIPEPAVIGQELLRYLESLGEEVNCTAMYFSTTDKEDRSKNCFIYELENIEKTCTPKVKDTEDSSVSHLVDDIRGHAERFFQTSKPNYSISSCKGYGQKNVTKYIEDFTHMVQWENTMQS